MNTLLVNASRSPHGNTRRVAESIGSVLGASILSPEEATPEALAAGDRIGFGSGIYWMGFDGALLDAIRALPDMSGRQAFVFATSGLPEPPFRRYTRGLSGLLESKGFRVAGAFTCRGIDTWGPFGLVGGVAKRHPDAQDLSAAREFATALV